MVHGAGGCEHLGLDKTTAKIQDLAYWVGYRKDIRESLKQCNICAQYHRGKIPRQMGLRSYLAGEPWERIFLNITGRHPKSSQGNVYILTMIDHFSRYALAFPIKDHTAPTVCRILMTKVFPVFGFPLQLLADNGPEFNSSMQTELQNFMGIERLRIAPYHPQGSGALGRFHRTLNGLLGKAVDPAQRNWDQLKISQGDVPQSWIVNPNGSAPETLIIPSAESLQDSPSSPLLTDVGRILEIVHPTLHGVDPAGVQGNGLPPSPTTMDNRLRGTRIRRPPDCLDM